jgi:oligosaccharide repeat unit polymerase
VSIGAYKNGGIATDFIASSGLGFVSTLSLLFSPFSYLTLGYHFYFLSKNDKRNAIKAILLSSSIFLPNLAYLSRAGAVTFILIYIANWIFVKELYPKKVRIKVRKIVFRTITVIGIVLFLISNNRFSDEKVMQDSLIQNPVMNSILWYFSQWYSNGIILIERYHPDLNLKGSSFAYFFNKVKEIFGFEIVDIKILRDHAFGELATHFNGLPAVLVYDFGYFGAVLFSVIFYSIVRRYAPKRGRITIKNLLLFSLLIPMPLMFFQGNQFTSSIYQLSVMYMIILRLLDRISIK